MNDPIPILPLSYGPPVDQPPSRWIRVPAVAVLCMLAAWSIGAGTNAINGRVSLFYFQTIVGWMYGTMRMRDVIWQGLMESTVFGIILMLTLTITYTASTAARCRLRYVGQVLIGAIVVTILLWTVGGLFGLMWATAEPTNFSNTFPLVPIPSDVPSLPAWGWVGGSIFGAYAGGILTVIGGPIVLHFRWRHVRRNHAGFSRASL